VANSLRKSPAAAASGTNAGRGPYPEYTYGDESGCKYLRIFIYFGGGIFRMRLA
jgi:hypothetical protein